MNRFTGLWDRLFGAATTWRLLTTDDTDDSDSLSAAWFGDALICVIHIIHIIHIICVIRVIRGFSYSGACFAADQIDRRGRRSIKGDGVQVRVRENTEGPLRGRRGDFPPTHGAISCTRK